MALTIINSTHSFVRFGETQPAAYCAWGDIDFCLPVYEQDDIYFQFVLAGTEQEIDGLCTQDNSGIDVSIVSECEGTPLITFTEKPQRFRLSPTQMLFNWSHGLPNFTSVISNNQCFLLQIEVSSVYANATFCSNCFERIADDCFTSVIEYGMDEDGFGFKYCYGGDIPGTGAGSETDSCEPTIVSFVNVPTVTIPYTALLKNKYGNFPTVQVWTYDELGQLVNAGISVAFDNYPPTLITADFGGNSTGIVIIK